MQTVKIQSFTSDVYSVPANTPFAVHVNSTFSSSSFPAKASLTESVKLVAGTAAATRPSPSRVTVPDLRYEKSRQTRDSSDLWIHQSQLLNFKAF